MHKGFLLLDSAQSERFVTRGGHAEPPVGGDFKQEQLLVGLIHVGAR